MISFQCGASLAKHLFPIVGAEGATAYRLGISAVLLLLLRRPWRAKPAQRNRSALWVYGLLAFPPPIHTMCVARSDRIKFPPSRRIALREVTHSTGDVAEVAGLRVTVPGRILFDLAFSDRSDGADRARALLARWPPLAGACARRISAVPNLPGKGVALRRLDEWSAAGQETAAQPALTRYTS